jgi:hypothetical protein
VDVGGEGTVHLPWCLSAALTADGDIEAGDSVYLKAGTYKSSETRREGCNSGFCISLSKGTRQRPITLRAWPNERAVFELDDDRFDVLQGNLRFIHLEFSASGWTNRFLDQNNPTEAEILAHDWGPGTGHYRSVPTVSVNSENVQFVNCVFHDLFQGLGLWTSSGSFLKGSLLYNNGFDTPSAGNGHGIYTQNVQPDIRVIKHNLIFSNFNYGYHAYTTNGNTDNFETSSNAVFWNNPRTKTNVLQGGLQPQTNNSFVGNVVLGLAEFGYTFGSTNMRVERNHFVGPVVVRGKRVEFYGNDFHGVNAGTPLLNIREDADGSLAGWSFEGNLYRRTSGNFVGHLVGAINTVHTSLVQWQAASALDATSAATNEITADVLKLWPSDEIAGEGLIFAYTPSGVRTLTIDLSSFRINEGEEFTVRHVFDAHGAALINQRFSAAFPFVSLDTMPPCAPPNPLGGWGEMDNAQTQSRDLNGWIVRQRIDDSFLSKGSACRPAWSVLALMLGWAIWDSV